MAREDDEVRRVHEVEIKDIDIEKMATKGNKKQTKNDIFLEEGFLSVGAGMNSTRGSNIERTENLRDTARPSIDT